MLRAFETFVTKLTTQLRVIFKVIYPPRASRSGALDKGSDVVLRELWFEPRELSLTHAIVLIQAERDAIPGLGGALAEVEGVAEAYSVTGEWDFVALVRVTEHERLAEVVTGRLAQLPGIRRTYTMVAFEVFSRHDLEAMFSIGN